VHPARAAGAASCEPPNAWDAKIIIAASVASEKTFLIME
jgi:hypothetical protein